MTNGQGRAFRGVWIPKTLWLTKKLSAGAKTLLVEIDSLSNHGGSCFASNAHFGRMFDACPRTIQRWSAELEAKALIKVEVTHVAGARGGRRRFLSLLPTGLALVGRTALPEWENEEHPAAGDDIMNGVHEDEGDHSVVTTSVSSRRECRDEDDTDVAVVTTHVSPPLCTKVLVSQAESIQKSSSALAPSRRGRAGAHAHEAGAKGGEGEGEGEGDEGDRAPKGERGETPAPPQYQNLLLGQGEKGEGEGEGEEGEGEQVQGEDAVEEEHLPPALSGVAPGDVIVHEKGYHVVIERIDPGSFIVISPKQGRKRLSFCAAAKFVPLSIWDQYQKTLESSANRQEKGGRIAESASSGVGTSFPPTPRQDFDPVASRAVTELVAFDFPKVMAEQIARTVGEAEAMRFVEKGSADGVKDPVAYVTSLYKRWKKEKEKEGPVLEAGRKGGEASSPRPVAPFPDEGTHVSALIEKDPETWAKFQSLLETLRGAS